MVWKEVGRKKQTKVSRDTPLAAITKDWLNSQKTGALTRCCDYAQAHRSAQFCRLVLRHAWDYPTYISKHSEKNTSRKHFSQAFLYLA